MNTQLNAMKQWLEAFESISMADNVEWMQHKANVQATSLRTAIEAAEAQPAPVQGWKLVPVVPTVEMVAAYDQAKYSDDIRIEANNVWVSMVNAAPPAQQEPAQDWKALAEEQAETIAKMTSEKYPFAHIRIDASEAEKEGALRDKLIELGWTPPAAQPAVPAEWIALAKEARRVAMEQTSKAAIPECGHFGAIAQDLDYLVGLMSSAPAAQPAPVQEPVAWLVYAKGSRKYFTLTFDLNKVPEIYIGGEALPLYTTPPAAQPAPVQQILEAFPLLDDEGLDQDEHHCEWALQQDRKRLHAMLAHGITEKGGAA